jgi:hypothetical protein
MTRFIPIENVKFSKRLSDIEQHPNKVVLKFTDGEIAEASILAGADGIKSNIRRHVLEHSHPTQVQPVYANAYCYRAVLPISSANAILGDLTDVAKFFFGRGRAVISYLISGGEVDFQPFKISEPSANEYRAIGAQPPVVRCRPKALAVTRRRHRESHPRGNDGRFPRAGRRSTLPRTPSHGTAGQMGLVPSSTHIDLLLWTRCSAGRQRTRFFTVPSCWRCPRSGRRFGAF